MPSPHLLYILLLSTDQCAAIIYHQQHVLSCSKLYNLQEDRSLQAPRSKLYNIQADRSLQAPRSKLYNLQADEIAANGCNRSQITSRSQSIFNMQLSSTRSTRQSIFNTQLSSIFNAGLQRSAQW